jgi:hypothetical protein
MSGAKSLAVALAASVLAVACSATQLSGERLETIKEEIRAEYSKRFSGAGDGSVLDVYLNTVDGKATGYVKFVAAGVTMTHQCEVTVYDDGQVVWGCKP